ncbi:HTH-type transcriptional regulator Hpr [Macrococcus epidermidis]|uniref:HTH-type transcriptional regulator Hpr n=2 Tax=Staphylococcaceae TaxID=90964 RepID=A0A2G5NVB6_9STAP|nr:MULTISPECIES: HTH-type transcriptional regulator Hpr [Macrococcus]MCG7420771.1 HTH-type transcriptional regulator Hpr [Macrococcus epidermidis]MCH4984629.1 HTH-type transcriptional regulator Hpr [Macrococcus sp. PK]RAI79431.1 HTH-type transcriptional regulator Hpr [Macrococcus goetzii]RAK44302.1 HTH-type transcriptional regulator Hpr [Macrococcus epidermidis]TDM39584.1 HTH-type transcriptional regulator Hpr [Macrococcus goetzii]
MKREKDVIEKMLFTHKVSQLSKALWKTVEKDWQNWIKPYDLNINEHHILIIIRNLEKATISQVSQYGVMHVSTVFNFAKNLEKRGYLTMPKSEFDKRNTYLELTEKGKELLYETYHGYKETDDRIYDAANKYNDIMHDLPSFTELKYIVAQIYGDDFIKHLDKSHNDLLKVLLDENETDNA